MAFQSVTIPITDHGTDGVCTQFYTVRYKASYDPNWTTVSPNPVSSPITINMLAGLTEYQVEIVRYCCDGTSSTVASKTFTTP